MITVSVGIVAHNEERNIKSVLNDVLNQKQKNWQLKKIYVACGGCTDKTVEFAKSFDSPFIDVLENPKRQGKAVDEQKIFDLFNDDYLVMFDADVRLDGKEVIVKLIKVFSQDKKIQLVGGNPRPFKPVTFFERAVYTTFMSLDESRLGLKNGHNIYGASGQCLAIKKSLVKKIKFPSGIVAEDDYIYFTNLKLKGNFKYCEDAVVHYKLPKKFSDYFRQVLRSDTASSIAHVHKHFGSVVDAEYHRPVSFYAKIVLRSFLWNPLGTVYMILIRIFSRIVIPFTSKHYSLNWYTANSTK